MANIKLTLRSRLLLSFVAAAIVIGILSILSGIHITGATEARSIKIFFAWTFGILIAAAAASCVILHSILAPIRKLQSAIDEMAAGPALREIEIGQAPPEVEALTSAFNRLQQAVRERRRENQEKLLRSDRLAAIGQLAAGVAHEINNPLGSILLFTRLVMKESAADGRVRENLDRIEKETKRCQSIVQGLLDFARQREPNVESVDINELLAMTLEFFERQSSFKNVEVVRRFKSRLPHIQADLLQLQQVFMNIIINALDAMDGCGRLTLETTDENAGDCVEIRISDTGCGIAPDTIGRIFDPFFTTKEAGRGTGLGLSVSYGIIQAHHGDIRVVSAPGAGSAFTIALPKSEGGS